jgi:hypothetical protein
MHICICAYGIWQRNPEIMGAMEGMEGMDMDMDGMEVEDGDIEVPSSYTYTPTAGLLSDDLEVRRRQTLT